MNPSLRRLLLGASTPVASGARVGFNVNSTSYYDGGGKMANSLTEASVTGTPNALGFPQAGAACSYGIISETKWHWLAHKPGTYVVKGTGTGAQLTTYGVGFTSDVFTTTNGVAFRRTVVVPALTAPTGDAAITVASPMQLGLAVSSAGVSDMSDLWVGHIDNESKFGGTSPADYFSVEAIADYATASKGPLRTMPWQQQVQSWMQDVGEIPVDGAIGFTGWLNDQPTGARLTKTAFLPSPEMLGRLAVATGMELWLNVHPQMTDATMTAYFERVNSIYSSGIIYIEVGNEPWNFAYYGINANYLGSRYSTAGNPGYGAGLLADNSIAAIMQGLAHASLRAWKAAEAVFGAGRVKKMVNVQLVWPDPAFNCLDYVDPGIRQAGVKVGAQMDSAAVSTYPNLCLDATPNGLHTGRGVTQGPQYGLSMSRGWFIKNKIWLDSASNGGNAALWFEKAWRNSVDMVVEYYRLWNLLLVAKGYPTLKAEYEGHWNHDDMPLYTSAAIGEQLGMIVAYDGTTGAMTPTTAAINGDTFPTAVIADWFEDGDLIETTWAGGSSGMTDHRSYRMKVIGGAIYAFDTAANYATGTTGAAVTGGTSRNFLLSNVTRMDAFSEFMMNLLWSSPSAIDGKSIFDYLHDSYKGAGLDIFCGFVMIGGSNTAFNNTPYSGGSSPWAMKPDGHWQTNTAALNKHKSLT